MIYYKIKLISLGLKGPCITFRPRPPALSRVQGKGSTAAEEELAEARGDAPPGGQLSSSTALCPSKEKRHSRLAKAFPVQGSPFYF